MVHYSRKSRVRTAGYTIITFSLASVMILGMVGLAVDVGRAFISRSEAQVFTDSAALAAALELDGTTAGLDRARAQVTANTNKWNFNTSSFGTVTTSFSTSAAGPWEQSPGSATGYMFVKTSTAVNTPAPFMGMFRSLTPNISGTGQQASAMSVGATSVAGQEQKTTFSEGLFPFSPYAHPNGTDPIGLTPGVQYTFRWASNPKISSGNVCQGDQTGIDLSQQQGNERGYIEETSANTIRQAIGGDYQTTVRSVGDSVNMTGGAKNTERTAILNRIATDTNSSATNYAAYVASGTGNGQRVVAMPINTGAPNYTIVQYGAFFILPSTEYGVGGNQSWCAEYIGAYVQGGDAGGAGGNSGAYVVRLVQ
jgi:Flp pilus assembly protein TadG